MTDDDTPGMADPHYFGGQAVIEGVMMRGSERWAVATRRPAGDIYVESHPVSDFPERYPAFRRPVLRGMFALVDTLGIGLKALSIAASQAVPADEEPLDTRQLGGTLVVAVLFFIGLFIVLPNLALSTARSWLGDGLGYHVAEGLARIGIFLGYLAAISLLPDIRRVFAYHGAEHKTISAWEHGERLEVGTIDTYPTLHVRCGTNFLIIVLVLALIVYSVVGVLIPAPAGGWLATAGYQMGLRVALLPLIAGLAYEGIRLGAAHGRSLLIRPLMTPGLWLQKLTTREPGGDQIEVAVRAFEAVASPEDLHGRLPALPSEVVRAPAAQPAEAAAGSDAAGGRPAAER